MAINPATGLEDPNYDPNATPTAATSPISLNIPQAVGTGATLAMGAQTADAIKNAANTMQSGLQSAEKTIGTYAQPYTTTGAQANQQLATGLQAGGQFNTPFTMEKAANMPAMEFARTQGMDTIQNSAAAKGGLLGTNTLAGLEKFGAENAAQYENQAFNQWLQQNAQTLGGLENLSGTGAQVASTAGSNIAGLQSQGAQVGMDAILGANNAYNQAVQNAISAYKSLSSPAATTSGAAPKVSTGATSTMPVPAASTTPIQAPTLVPSVPAGTQPGLGNTTVTTPTGAATLTSPVGLNGVTTSGTATRPATDASGNPIVDPATGQPMTEAVPAAPKTLAPSGTSVALQPTGAPSLSVNAPKGQATVAAADGTQQPVASADTGAVPSPVTGGYTTSTGAPLVQDTTTGLSVDPATLAPELSINAYDSFISSITGTDPWSAPDLTAVDSWAEFAPTTDLTAEFANIPTVDFSQFAAPDLTSSIDFPAMDMTYTDPTYTMDSFTPVDLSYDPTKDPNYPVY